MSDAHRTVIDRRCVPSAGILLGRCVAECILVRRSRISIPFIMHAHLVFHTSPPLSHSRNVRRSTIKLVSISCDEAEELEPTFGGCGPEPYWGARERQRILFGSIEANIVHLQSSRVRYVLVHIYINPERRYKSDRIPFIGGQVEFLSHHVL